MVNQSHADKSRELVKPPAEWKRWKQLVRDCPDLRDDKIASSREALATGTYEHDEVLNATLDRMSADMGVRLND